MANISIDVKTAEQLYDLFHNVEAADAHYQRCQSDQFRVHIKAVYQNAGVSKAFETLRSLIDDAAAAPVKADKAAQSPRKSVLGN